MQATAAVAVRLVPYAALVLIVVSWAYAFVLTRLDATAAPPTAAPPTAA